LGIISDATIVSDRRRSAEISFGVWVTSCRSPHPNAHRKLRPLHSFTYYATTTRPNETLLSGNIPGPVRKVPPEERCNLGRFDVVVGDGVDGVHGGEWTENRDDRKKKVAQSYFFFFAFLDKKPRQIVDF
jgi:hypothetical protein